MDINIENELKNKKRVNILGTNIDSLTMQETVNIVNIYIKNKKPLHLMGVNADKINECHKNEKLKKIVNSCEVINADGISVVIASRILNRKVLERIAGIDLMISLLEMCNNNHLKIYLLGATQEVIEKTVETISTKYHNVIIAGYQNGYYNEEEVFDIIKEIKKIKPDIVFVGITSPKKEYLINLMLNNGCNSVFMGVGGSFDVISGKIKRAPIILQKIGLEWLYRFVQEPKRLFKRYIFGNVSFIIKVIKERIRK